MSKKKYDEKYIADIQKTLDEVMYQEPCPQDWSQFCLNVRQVMIAVATIYGNSTDEDKHKLRGFLQELVVGCVIPNLQEWDIQYSKKQ
jgi:hypothetical protein